MDRRNFIKKATMAAAGAAVVSPVSAMLNQVLDKKCKVLLINGSPRTNGGILSLMQRLFFSAGHLVQNKPAAALAVCRRGGATATLQR